MSVTIIIEKFEGLKTREIKSLISKIYFHKVRFNVNGFRMSRKIRWLKPICNTIFRVYAGTIYLFIKLKQHFKSEG